MPPQLPRFLNPELDTRPLWTTAKSNALGLQGMGLRNQGQATANRLSDLAARQEPERFRSQMASQAATTQGQQLGNVRDEKLNSWMDADRDYLTGVREHEVSRRDANDRASDLEAEAMALGNAQLALNYVQTYEDYVNWKNEAVNEYGLNPKIIPDIDPNISPEAFQAHIEDLRFRAQKYTAGIAKEMEGLQHTNMMKEIAERNEGRARGGYGQPMTPMDWEDRSGTAFERQFGKAGSRMEDAPDYDYWTWAYTASRRDGVPIQKYESWAGKTGEQLEILTKDLGKEASYHVERVLSQTEAGLKSLQELGQQLAKRGDGDAGGGGDTDTGPPKPLADIEKDAGTAIGGRKVTRAQQVEKRKRQGEGRRRTKEFKDEYLGPTGTAFGARQGLGSGKTTEQEHRSMSFDRVTMNPKHKYSYGDGKVPKTPGVVFWNRDVSAFEEVQADGSTKFASPDVIARFLDSLGTLSER